MTVRPLACSCAISSLAHPLSRRPRSRSSRSSVQGCSRSGLIGGPSKVWPCCPAIDPGAPRVRTAKVQRTGHSGESPIDGLAVEVDDAGDTALSVPAGSRERRRELLAHFAKAPQRSRVRQLSHRHMPKDTRGVGNLSLNRPVSAMVRLNVLPTNARNAALEASGSNRTLRLRHVSSGDART